MCSPAKCSKCGKVGWVGCGAHVEQVLRGVPEDQRCKCREAQPQPADMQKSVLDWLRGR